MMERNLFAAARLCLEACEPDEKLRLTRDYAEDWRAGRLEARGGEATEHLDEPGRPARLRLVQPRELPQRGPGSEEGRATLFHALAHIEFNAVNLAWDAVFRFQDMPGEYYDDWVRVAEEEADHFELLRAHLQTLGHDYGDFPAHNGLWEMARKTAHDPVARMALVPRCLEARGLDVNPAIKSRLEGAGDREGAALMDIILRDEIGHVAIGDRWYRHLCGHCGLEPEATYRDLVARYMNGGLKGPFHIEARRRAGFSEDELAYLQGLG